ncbi:hypothetical protein [Nonomuraea sp. NPDC050404]|uniref:hypothetical protein n=1 Tax=Nonomuraea sp. NPDC050404 TaxID=3155783 RepID=UPI0033E1E479
MLCNTAVPRSFRPFCSLRHRRRSSGGLGNVAKYLKKAVDQYLPTVKLQDLDQPERASVRGKGASHE